MEQGWGPGRNRRVRLLPFGSSHWRMFQRTIVRCSSTTARRWRAVLCLHCHVRLRCFSSSDIGLERKSGSVHLAQAQKKRWGRTWSSFKCPVGPRNGTRITFAAWAPSAPSLRPSLRQPLPRKGLTEGSAMPPKKRADPRLAVHEANAGAACPGPTGHACASLMRAIAAVPGRSSARERRAMSAQWVGWLRPEGTVDSFNPDEGLHRTPEYKVIGQRCAEMTAECGTSKTSSAALRG